MAFTNPKRMGAYILTPTGASIAEDESNVGQQMLKKMGWTPETGLGKNNNGIVEPVKASCNYGRKGLGKGSTQSSTGMVQQSAFNAILQSLTKHKSSVGNEKKTGLEDKSKQSHSRVHYGKFVRAKDVSQYSQNSLKIILGASVDKTQSSPEHDTVSSAPEDNGSRDTAIKQEFGVKTYSSSTDLASYFSLKRKALKSNTGDLARKRARFTPTSDEDRGEESPSVGATPELPDDDLVKPTNPYLDEKENPRSSRPVASKVESEESDSDGSPTEAQVEVEEEPLRQRSAVFSTSNVHSLTGYPFY